MAVKPSLYGVDDIPPLSAILLRGLRHVGVFPIALILPVVLTKEAGLSLGCSVIPGGWVAAGKSGQARRS
jgi:hypothetical protein